MDSSFSASKIAKLAYLELSETETKDFQKQFAAILSYVDKLKDIPMTSEEAKKMGAFHITTSFYELMGLDAALTLREEGCDAPATRLNLTNDEALKNAPQTGGIPGELLFEVPSIIER